MPPSIPGTPVITVPPDDVIAIDNELVNFTCSASGLPQPDILFPFLPASYTIIPGLKTSTLQFQATLSLNLTSVQCTAVNVLGNTSTNATLTIAGNFTSYIMQLVLKKKTFTEQ